VLGQELCFLPTTNSPADSLAPCAHTRLQWTVDALHVRDQVFSLRRLSFLPTTKPGEGVKTEEAKP